MYKSLILAVAPTLASAGGHCAVEYHHVIDIRGPGNDDPTTGKCAHPLQYAGNDKFAEQLETDVAKSGGKAATVALFCGSGTTTKAAKEALIKAGWAEKNIVDLGGIGDMADAQKARGQPHAGSPEGYKPTLSSIADSCGCLKTAGHDHAHEEKKEAAPAAAAHDDHGHDHSVHGCNTVTIDIRTAKLFKETKGAACAVNVPYNLDDMKPNPDFVKNYNAAIAPKRRLAGHAVNEMVVGMYCQAASSVTAAMKTLKDAEVDTSKIHNMGGLADNSVAIHASCTCKCPTIMIDIRAADIFKQSDCTSAHSVPYMKDGKPDPKFKDNLLAKLPSNFKKDGTHTVGVFCKAKSSVDAALALFADTEYAPLLKNMGGLEMRRLAGHEKPKNNLLNIQTACTCGGGGCGAESKPVEAAATVTEEAQSCTASGKKFDYVIDIRPQHMFDETNADKTIPEQHKQPCATHYKFWVQYEDSVKKEFVENVKKHVNNKLDAPVAVYCRGKNGANAAAQMLKENGFTNVTSLGGLRTGQQPHIADVCQCLSTDGAAAVSKKATDAAPTASSAGYTCASMAVLGTAAVLLQ